MIIPQDIKKAITLCMAQNVPFITYLFPGNDEVIFFSNPSLTDGEAEESVTVSFFGKDNPDMVTLRRELNVNETITAFADKKALDEPEIKPWPLSTEYMQYRAQVHRIVNRLSHRGGKTVLSRVICGKTTSDTDWADIASRYFDKYPDTFRYLYYTAETGCWLGASPELLLEHNSDEKTFSTMALAGTRSIDEDDNDWDKKNIEEHNYVTDYIVKTLENLGIKVDVSPAENLKYGNIEHLCHHITAHLNDNMPSFNDIMQQLSPTPALAGYPVEQAISDINEFEVHPRHCYGGFIAVTDSKGLHAYVNLRCVHFDTHNYCIYAGGGLTANSIDTTEWNETESKSATLRALLATK